MLRVPRDIQVAFDRKIQQAAGETRGVPGLPEVAEVLFWISARNTAIRLIPREVWPVFCRSSLRKTNRRSDRRKRPGPWGCTMIWLQGSRESRTCGVGTPFPRFRWTTGTPQERMGYASPILVRARLSAGGAWAIQPAGAKQAGQFPERGREGDTRGGDARPGGYQTCSQALIE
jgi:hypothetical protein